MSLIDRLMTKWRRKRTQKATRIRTPWGDVTESARRQAAANMAADPAKKVAVIELLAKKLGSVEAGEAEARRRYPEAFADERKQ